MKKILLIALLIVPLMSIGQAPTNRMGDLYCRDSLAESKVIFNRERLKECDTLLKECVYISSKKTSQIAYADSLIALKQKQVLYYQNELNEANKANKKKLLIWKVLAVIFLGVAIFR